MDVGSESQRQFTSEDLSCGAVKRRRGAGKENADHARRPYIPNFNAIHNVDYSKSRTTVESRSSETTSGRKKRAPLTPIHSAHTNKALMDFKVIPRVEVHPIKEGIKYGLIDIPQFSQLTQPKKRDRNYPLMTVGDLSNLTTENVGQKVILLLTIEKMETGTDWFFYECTTCQHEVRLDNRNFRCSICERIVPYPDRKFQVYALCSDDTGTIAVFLNDREVRRLTNRTVFSLTSDDTLGDWNCTYPQELQKLIHRDIRVLLELTSETVAEGCNLFPAAEALLGHTDAHLMSQSTTVEDALSQFQSQFSEGTSSTVDYHLDAISQLCLATPSTTANHGEKEKKKWTPYTT